MRSTPFSLLSRFFFLIVLAAGLVGCNALGITGDDDDENEVNVTITQVGADFVVADDGFTYEVNADTDFDGFDALTEILNQQVEIEFEPIANNNTRRLALEIELGDDD
jgi:hypothetical protein